MQFEEIRAVALAHDDVVLPASWAQGRTVCGGLSAGLLCDAVSQGVGAERRLRYQKVGFLRPLQAERPFRIEMDEVSSGRKVVARSPFDGYLGHSLRGAARWRSWR